MVVRFLGAPGLQWIAATARSTLRLQLRKIGRDNASMTKPVTGPLMIMDTNGGSGATVLSRLIRGVRIHSVCMVINSYRQRMLIILSYLKQGVPMTGKICRRSAMSATAEKPHCMTVDGGAKQRGGRGMFNLYSSGSMTVAGSLAHAPAILSLGVNDAG